MNRAAGVVGAHEAGERRDPRPRADQDERRPALDGSERGILADERLDPVADPKAVQEGRAEAARSQADADFERAVARGRSERVEARQVVARRHDAEEIAGLEPRQPRAPPATGVGGRVEAQDRDRRADGLAIDLAPDERERRRLRPLGDVPEIEVAAERGAEVMAPLRELLRRAPVDALQVHEPRPALRVERVGDRVGVAAEFRERAVAEAEHGERDRAFEPGEPVEKLLAPRWARRRRHRSPSG